MTDEDARGAARRGVGRRHPLLRHRAALRARAVRAPARRLPGGPSPAQEFVVSTKVGRLLEPSPETADRRDDDDRFAVPRRVRRVWDFSAAGIRAQPRGVARAARPRPRRRPLPARPGASTTSTAGARDRRARAGRAARRGRRRAIGVGSKSTDGAARRRAHRRRSTSSMVAGRYTLLEQPAPTSCCRCAGRAGVGVVARGGRSTPACWRRRAREPGDRYEYGAVPDELLERARAARRRLRAARGRAAGGGAAVPAARAGGPLASWWARRPPEQVRENARPHRRAESRTALWDELGRPHELVARRDRRRPPAPLGPRPQRVRLAHARARPAARDLPPEQARAELEAAGVGAAVLVQAEDSERDTELHARGGATGIRGSPAWSAGCSSTTPRSAGASSTAGRHTPASAACGTSCTTIPRDDFLPACAVRAVAAAARRRAAPVRRARTPGRGTWPPTADLAAELPELTVVVDHLGKPPSGGAELGARGGTMLREVAAHPNTIAKVSGLQVPGRPFTVADGAPRLGCGAGAVRPGAADVGQRLADDRAHRRATPAPGRSCRAGRRS